MQSEDNLTEFINSYEYSENSDDIPDEDSFSDCSPFITQPEALLVKTSVLSMRNSLLNIRESLNNYRSQAASKIQKFFRQSKLKPKLRQISALIRNLQISQFQTHKKASFESIWLFSQSKIEKAKLRNTNLIDDKLDCSQISQNFPSPRRKMLVRAVSIGRALKKIDNLVEKVVSRRTSPVSPVKTNQGYAKKVKKGNRDQTNLKILHCTKRNQKSFSIKLVSGSCSDESESQDSKSTTPGLDHVGWKTFRTSDDSTMESVNEPISGNIILRRKFRVRAQRRILMKLDELENALAIDLKAPSWSPSNIENSIVPCIFKDSKFCASDSFEMVKEKLICEYKDLIKL